MLYYTRITSINRKYTHIKDINFFIQNLNTAKEALDLALLHQAQMLVEVSKTSNSNEQITEYDTIIEVFEDATLTTALASKSYNDLELLNFYLNVTQKELTKFKE